MPAKKKAKPKKKSAPKKKASAKKKAPAKKKAARKRSYASGRTSRHSGPFFASSSWEPEGFFAPARSGKVFKLSERGVRASERHVAPTATATGIVTSLGISKSRFDASRKSLMSVHRSTLFKRFK
jgi:hypothetical protein